MKKHGFRSVFSLLLAVMMVCSMLPTAAFAEGDVEEQPVAVETYTVTYTDGMGGVAFAEQKTEGLLYGDPTPAFAGEPALDGYTFTGWDQEIAETVTQSVTYTAQWQAVPADGQQEAQSDVQPEADGNGEADMQKGPDGWPPLNPGGGDRKPEHNKKLQISLYVDDGQSRTKLKTVNVERKSELEFTHRIAPLSDVAQGNSGKYGEVTSVTGDWASGNPANEGDTVTWGHNAESGVVVYNVAPQALDTGHKIDVTFTILYVGDEFRIGYNYGTSEKTQFVCQYSQPHSDTAYTNHTIAISDIKAAAGRATVNSGYQIVGWSKEDNANPTVWPLDKSGTTACNKGTTIYLVAKDPNPTKYTYVLKYDANSGTDAPADASWSTTDAAIRYHSFTVTNTVPTLAGYTFKGWKAKDGSDTIYTGGALCSVSQQGNDIVKNGNTWTRTLYAVWEENAPEKTYTVTYTDGVGGTVFTDDVHSGLKSGDTTPVFAGGTPTREGYKFLGWSPTVVETVTEDATYTAQWQAEGPTAPSELSKDEIKALLKNALKIVCKKINTHTETYDVDEALAIAWAGEGDERAYIEFEVSPYLDKFNSKYGAHTSTADNPKPILRAKVWLKWSNGQWTRSTNEPTVYYVTCETQPNAPSKGDVVNIFKKVAINCTTSHGSASYDLKEDAISIGQVYYNQKLQGYACMVTISSAPYVTKFNSEHGGVTHNPADATRGFEFTYSNGQWNAPSSDTEPVVSVIFNVTCEMTPTPDIKKPTFDELKDLLDVKVECTNESAAHESKFERYELKNADGDSKFVIGEVDQSGDFPTCTVTIGSAPYVAAFDSTTGKTHNPPDTTKTVNLVYSKETREWELEKDDDAVVVFQVACTTEEPSNPYKPGNDEVKELLGDNAVQVICTNEEANHAQKFFGLIDDTFEVRYTEGNNFCEVYVNSTWQYVEAYNDELGIARGSHTSDTSKQDQKIITLYWDKENRAWTPGEARAELYVVCQTQSNDPVPPTRDEIKALLGNVTVTCSKNKHESAQYALDEVESGYKGLIDNNDPYTFAVEVDGQKFVDKYSETRGTHSLDDARYKFVYLKAEETDEGSYVWTVNTEKSDQLTFKAACADEITPPTAKQVDSQLDVKVSCTNGSAAHMKDISAFLYEELLPGSFSIGEVTGDAQSGYKCVITVRAAQYVQDFAAQAKVSHTLTGNDEKTVTLYYEGGGWTVGNGNRVIEFTVTCENVSAEKYTVTYTDGVDGVEVFKDQVYAGLTAGTATPAFNGTPTRAGYVFAGWNPVVAATVTGNATYTATWKVDANNNGKPDDEELRYTVTYVDGANGKAFASQVYTGLLSGTATPKFNGTPLRSGYVFIGWSPVWSGTVTGNVTYTATWSTVTGGLDKVPKTGDSGLTLALSALVLFSFCGATACVISTKKRG